MRNDPQDVLTNHEVFTSVSSRTHTHSLRLRPASVAVGCSTSWVSGSRGRKWEDDEEDETSRWRLEGIIAVILILASLIRFFFFFFSDGWKAEEVSQESNLF